MAELMDVKGNLKVYNTAGSEIWKSGPGRVLRVFSQILGKLGQNQKGQEILIVRRSRYIYIYIYAQRPPLSKFQEIFYSKSYSKGHKLAPDRTRRC